MFHQQQQRTTLAFSVLSGLFAALSGFLGKVTFDPGLVIAVSILNVRPNFMQIIQVGLGCLMVISNILMLQTFNKALQISSTTIQVSIINTASNFIFTALIGFLAFGERLSLIWWSGTSMILLGTYIISSSEQHTPTVQHGRNKLD